MEKDVAMTRDVQGISTLYSFKGLIFDKLMQKIGFMVLIQNNCGYFSWKKAWSSS